MSRIAYWFNKFLCKMLIDWNSNTRHPPHRKQMGVGVGRTWMGGEVGVGEQDFACAVCVCGLGGWGGGRGQGVK